MACPILSLVWGHAQLAYSEKGYRKMAEMLKTYRHALADEEVLGVFKVRDPACLLHNPAFTCFADQHPNNKCMVWQCML